MKKNPCLDAPTVMHYKHRAGGWVGASLSRTKVQRLAERAVACWCREQRCTHRSRNQPHQFRSMHPSLKTGLRQYDHRDGYPEHSRSSLISPSSCPLSDWSAPSVVKAVLKPGHPGRYRTLLCSHRGTWIRNRERAACTCRFDSSRLFAGAGRQPWMSYMYPLTVPTPCGCSPSSSLSTSQFLPLSRILPDLPGQPVDSHWADAGRQWTDGGLVLAVVGCWWIPH